MMGVVKDRARREENVARRAIDGDRHAVAELVRALQPDVYGLALRMLWHREDAEDATQEILVRVVTRLAQFDFRSALRTWVYRVAANYLLDVKRSCVERKQLGFSGFAADLTEGLSSEGPAEGERSVLTEEVRVGCTLGMLQCLDRPHRLAYVLGEILGLPAPEAAAALEIAPARFRKRLQRARASIEDFTRAHCGLVSDKAACRCNRRVPVAIRLGRVRPNALEHAARSASFEEARAVIARIDAAKRTIELHRTTQPRGSTLDVARLVDAALTGAPPTRPA